MKRSSTRDTPRLTECPRAGEGRGGAAPRTALRAGPAPALRRRRERTGSGASGRDRPAPLDAEHLALTPAAGTVQVVVRVEAAPERGLLERTLLDPAEPGS